MSVCSPCLQVNNVPYCVGNITIGTVTELNTAVYVFVKNIGKDTINRISTTTDGSGTVIIADFDNINQTKQTFELWVTTQTSENRLSITVGGSEGDCIGFRFEDRLDGNNQQIAFASFTFSV